MEELLKEIKEHYIEQPNVKRGKFYIEALTLEKIIKDWLTNNKRLQLEVMPKIADLDKLPLWTEIYIQPLDINKKEETKVYWLKHPQIKPKTFYDKNITNLINEFLEFWKNR